MCGIAGAVTTAVADGRRCVEDQVRTLDHRGPDSWGVFHGEGAAIGQTRLAIIDLVTGDPPIADEDGSIGAVLNGEIYNFRAIRAELAEQGHRLTTTGDTEVIAHLAEHLEPVDLARRLHGMFAFAVWDKRRRRLILGRDRLGKKPLYYWSSGDQLVFGSEIKAVLAHPAVPRRLAPGAVDAYLTFGYVPTPRTFFDEIRSLPPGHVLVLDEGGVPHIEPYWRPEIAGSNGAAPLDLSLEEAGVEVRTRLGQAVERRLVADVPIGAFLSGGIDSSAVVALMSQFMSSPVQTFTIGFEDNEGFDERPYARMVAERYATDHVEFVVQPDAVELIDRLVEHYDQPFGDSSAIPTYLLSELTRKHVTVSLCGDGGDELFAGYERFTAGLAVGRYGRLLSPASRLALRALTPLPGAARGRLASGERFLRRAETGLPDAMLAWVGFVPPEWRARFIGHAESWATDDYRSVWAESAGGALLDRLLMLNLRTYLLDDLLPKVDRMAMTHALEVRSPFLDHELVEFALRLPPQVKAFGLARKRVLKEAMKDLLPAEILHRRKRGFGVPLARWFRSELGEYLEGTLGSPSARVRAHLDPQALDDLIAEHQHGTANHYHALWTLLTLEVFLRSQGW